jgi:hypothetical protein
MHGISRNSVHPDVSTSQEPELYLDLSGQKEPVLTWDVFTPQGPELHMDGSAQQELHDVHSRVDHRGQILSP